MLEDESQEGDDLNLSIKGSGVDATVIRTIIASSDSHSKGPKAHFAVESEKYDPAWTVRLRPEIDEETVQ